MFFEKQNFTEMVPLQIRVLASIGEEIQKFVVESMQKNLPAFFFFCSGSLTSSSEGSTIIATVLELFFSLVDLVRNLEGALFPDDRLVLALVFENVLRKTRLPVASGFRSAAFCVEVELVASGCKYSLRVRPILCFRLSRLVASKGF